jgi:hypothetical protein
METEATEFFDGDISQVFQTTEETAQQVVEDFQSTEGFQPVVEGYQIPEGFQQVVEGQIPEGFQQVVEGQIPEGFQQVVEGQIPEGFQQVVEGHQIPEGFQPIQGEQELAGIPLGSEMDVQEEQEYGTAETIIDNEVVHYLTTPQPIYNQPEVEVPLEDQLKSQERLDRSSPDLWPQNMPTSAQQVFSKNNIKTSHLDSVGSWAQGLDPEDINLLHQFGSLTSSSLVEEVKKLQNIAYQLDLEEKKELTRGRLLHVLDSENDKENGRRNKTKLWK